MLYDLNEKNGSKGDPLGFDPEYYLHTSSVDIRKYFNWINKDSVERVASALEELENESKAEEKK